ncbi:EamA family transporter [Methylolobus aquaticus]|nr:EamA family transporter [Methylolobus aquaticus]
MKTKIWIALLAVYLVWGSTYLVIRFAVETLPPFLSAGLRFLVSGLLLLAWRYAAGDALPSLRQWRSAAIVGTLLLLGGNGLVCWAEQTVPSGIAALMIGAVPMFLVLADAFRPKGMKPTGRVIAGLAVGFCGIYLLVGPSQLSNGIQWNALGVTALLLAGPLWAIGSVYSKTADLPKSALMTTGAEMLAGGFSLMVASCLSDEWTGFSFAQVSTHSWLALAYLTAFGSMVGFVAYIWLLQNAPIPLVATYAYVNPLVAVFLGNWFAQEPLTPRILSAAAAIIGAVVFINSAHSSRARTKAVPVVSE